MLWTEAGLEAIETREISVQRTFSGFDEFWRTSQLGSGIGPRIAALPDDRRESLKARLRERLPSEAKGQITIVARANAVSGKVPA